MKVVIAFQKTKLNRNQIGTQNQNGVHGKELYVGQVALIKEKDM